MKACFVDSSALVKRYRIEAGSERVVTLLKVADRLYMSRLAQVEVAAAIFRRGRGAGAPMLDLESALERFHRDMQISFEVIELEAIVVERAVAMVHKHGLRAADAIQLACATIAVQELPEHDLTFVASDHELNTAALAEGLIVVDPVQQ
jgi:predicted nucleic acid-binding protein